MHLPEWFTNGTFQHWMLLKQQTFSQYFQCILLSSKKKAELHSCHLYITRKAKFGLFFSQATINEGHHQREDHSIFLHYLTRSKELKHEPGNFNITFALHEVCGRRQRRLEHRPKRQNLKWFEMICEQNLLLASHPLKLTTCLFMQLPTCVETFEKLLPKPLYLPAYNAGDPVLSTSFHRDEM